MKFDGRPLTHEASETIRKMAVRRVLEGERPGAVIRAYGLCRTTIYKWRRAAKRGAGGTDQVARGSWQAALFE